MGVLFHGDRNGARNILLRYLSPSLQAHRLTEGKEDQLSTKLGPLRALPVSHRESPYGCSLCWHTPVFICHVMISLRKLKVKRRWKAFLVCFLCATPLRSMVFKKKRSTFFMNNRVAEWRKNSSGVVQHLN